MVLWITNRKCLSMSAIVDVIKRALTLFSYSSVVTFSTWSWLSQFSAGFPSSAYSGREPLETQVSVAGCVSCSFRKCSSLKAVMETKHWPERGESHLAAPITSDHSPSASLVKCSFSYSCAADDHNCCRRDDYCYHKSYAVVFQLIWSIAWVPM